MVHRIRLLEYGCALGATVLIAGAVQAQIRSPDAAPAVRAGSTPVLQVAGGEAGGGPASFADLAEKVEPAVIGVTAKVAVSRDQLPPGQSFGLGIPGQSDPNDEIPAPGAPREEEQAQKGGELTTVGSGFFISPDGYAVTNSHVVEASDTAQVRTHDDKIYTAKVIGKDPESDLALIKVDGRDDFSYAKLADQMPRVGDWVLTVGSPFGLQGTVTAGIVSARERSIEAASAEDLIQIDAPINTGDSGGPSFDSKGNVVGVNSMIFSPSGGSVGVAFAVPADTVKTVIPQLKDKGSVTRGWLGARVQSITPDIAEGLGMDNLRGAIIAGIEGNSPAVKAGLQNGDVITAVGDEPIKDAHALTKKIRAMAPGSSVKLDLLHDGQRRSANVTLAQLPDQAAGPPDKQK